MKHDQKLFLKILEAIEQSAEPIDSDKFNIVGYEKKVLVAHIVLAVKEYRYLEGIDVSTKDGAAFLELKLTGHGNYYLEYLKSNTPFKKMVALFSKRAGDIIISAITSAATAYLMIKLGLPDK